MLKLPAAGLHAQRPCQKSSDLVPRTAWPWARRGYASVRRHRAGACRGAVAGMRPGAAGQRDSASPGPWRLTSDRPRAGPQAESPAAV